MNTNWKQINENLFQKDTELGTYQVKRTIHPEIVTKDKKKGIPITIEAMFNGKSFGNSGDMDNAMELCNAHHCLLIPRVDRRGRGYWVSVAHPPTQADANAEGYVVWGKRLNEKEQGYTVKHVGNGKVISSLFVSNWLPWNLPELTTDHTFTHWTYLDPLPPLPEAQSTEEVAP